MVKARISPIPGIVFNNSNSFRNLTWRVRLHRRFYLGKSKYEEIGNKFGMSVSTVQTHIDRSVEKIIKVVEELANRSMS